MFAQQLKRQISYKPSTSPARQGWNTLASSGLSLLGRDTDTGRQDLIPLSRQRDIDYTNSSFLMPKKTPQAVAVYAPVDNISFDGRQVTVSGSGVTTTARAISGLMANHQLARGIDYTNPRYQNVPDKGPIPAGSYYLNPTEVQTPSQGGFSPEPWGYYRTRLHEYFFTMLRRSLFSTRSGGFFLHQDANHNGTAGCIGIWTHKDNEAIHQRIRVSTGTIPVEVKYRRRSQKRRKRKQHRSKRR